jgi:hypothetical protein
MGTGGASVQRRDGHQQDENAAADTEGGDVNAKDP